MHTVLVMQACGSTGGALGLWSSPTWNGRAGYVVGYDTHYGCANYCFCILTFHKAHGEACDGMAKRQAFERIPSVTTSGQIGSYCFKTRRRLKTTWITFSIIAFFIVLWSFWCHPGFVLGLSNGDIGSSFSSLAHLQVIVMPFACSLGPFTRHSGIVLGLLWEIVVNLLNSFWE